MPKIEFNDDVAICVARTLTQMGFKIDNKDKLNHHDLLAIADDQEKSREFIGMVQGPDAVKRGDPTYLERYRVRTEYFIREFLGWPIPADMDLSKEKFTQPKKEKSKMSDKDVNPKRPGVIKMIRTLLHKDKYSKDELYAVLKKEFPDRDERMKKTIGVQIGRSPKELGKVLHSEDIEGRGRVYWFEGDMPDAA